MKKETFKKIPNYEGLYQVSNFGNVKRFYQNGKTRILKQSIDRCGYKHLELCKDGKEKFFNVHRVIAKVFIPNEEDKPCVNHLDGNKLNNNVSNLQWCTHSENTQHAYNTGLKTPVRGESHKLSKLKECDVVNIRDSNLSAKELSKIYKVHFATIYRVKNNIRWTHVK